MEQRLRAPRLVGFYQHYLVERDEDLFAAQVAALYTVGTLERLAVVGDRLARRGAVLALGKLADYGSNAVMGRALTDDDRGVRMLADAGIRHLWCRAGDSARRAELAAIVELNHAKKFPAAIARCERLIKRAAWLAEAWNQRALALFSVGRHLEAIRDCHQTLEINPYHFGAATGMGQCYLEQGDRAAALECFRRALKLNPNLDGVRAQVLYLQRTLKSQE